MSSVEEIEQAIDSLPNKELWTLHEHVVAKCNELWDQEMQENVSRGALDFLWQEAEDEIRQGHARPLNELFDDQKLSQ